MNNFPQPSECDKFDPLLTSSEGGFLRMIWRRKFLIVLGAALGLTWGFIKYRQQPSVYKSTAQVLGRGYRKSRAPDRRSG